MFFVQIKHPSEEACAPSGGRRTRNGTGERGRTKKKQRRKKKRRRRNRNGAGEREALTRMDESLLLFILNR